MSHFSCLVIGPDVEAQLQPYHEFECTGVDDQHVQSIDTTERAKEEFPNVGKESFADWVASYYGYGKITPDMSVDLSGENKYGYFRVDDAGEVIEVIKRTNPNKHWDWWVVGGRWSGFLRLKNGSEVDECEKGEVDWEGMKDEAGEEAGEKWDRVHAIIADRSLSPWAHYLCQVKSGEITIEDARAAYHGQDVLRDIAKDKDLLWVNLDDFLVTREQYVQYSRLGAISTFAVVKDGQWYERGSMGWFGLVADEKGQDEWSQQFSLLLDGLPDDTPLTVVDCHT